MLAFYSIVIFLPVFGLQEETKVLGENSYKHKGNMQTLQGQTPGPIQGLNSGLPRSSIVLLDLLDQHKVIQATGQENINIMGHIKKISTLIYCINAQQ